MSISLRSTDLALSGNVTLISTDWQIATDMSFSPASMVEETLGDTVNTTVKMYPTILDPAIKYYARCRMLLSTGYTAWGNIDIFTPDDVDDSDVALDIPTVVMHPTITTNSDPVNHARFGITISVSGFSVIGNSDLESVTYVIETVDGQHVWSSIANGFDTQNIEVLGYILKPDTGYVIKAQFKSTTGDYSQLASLPIVTESQGRNTVLTNLYSMTVGAGNNITIAQILGANRITYTLYSMSNKAEQIWTTTKSSGDIYNAVLPTGLLKDNNKYLLSVTSNVFPTPTLHQFST